MEIIKHTFKSNGKLVKRTSKPTEIVLHCTATIEGKEYSVSDIDRWHKKRGFSCIGYNYVIYVDGSVHEGRDITYQGAHCVGKNNTGIGICYIGGLDAKTKKANDTRTDAQKEALFDLVDVLMKTYNIPLENVHAHYEFARKACPCFDIQEFKKNFELWQEKKYSEQSEAMKDCMKYQTKAT